MRHRTVTALLGLVVLGSGCWAGWAPFVSAGSSPAAAAERSLPLLVSPELVQAAESLPELQGWTLVPLGQFQRGSRFVLFAWPAIAPDGRVAQGAVLGLGFERGLDGQYHESGTSWAPRGSETPAELVRALGGPDYLMQPRNEGVPLDQLGPQLARRCRAFSEAAGRGDRAGAVQRAIAFTRLLSVDQAAYENSAAHLLSLCSGGYDLEHLGTRRQGDGLADVSLSIHRGSSGRRQVEADAERAGERGDQWVLTTLQWPAGS